MKQLKARDWVGRPVELVLKNTERMAAQEIALDKSVEEVIVVKVEAVVGVSNDAALDEVSAVDDGVEAVSGEADLKEPLNQV